MSLQKGGSSSSTSALGLVETFSVGSGGKKMTSLLASSAANAATILSAVVNETYEEELRMDPFRPKIWIAYVDTIKKSDASTRWLMYERAVKALPRSYKIWRRYLEERRANLGERDFILEEAYEEVNAIYERALVFLHKMPRIWIDYIQFLMEQKRITGTRRAIDAAIRTLPIHQHYRIWNEAIPWLKEEYVPRSTCLNLFRRYLMLEPGHVETFIAYLLQQEIFDEAAVRMVEILDNEEFVSINSKSKHQLWMDLCELVSTHPKDIRSIKIEPIIRQGISKFTDEVGRLWICLADHFIRLNWFDKARATYQEAIESITTAHDFALVYESYEVFLSDWVETIDEKDPVGEELQFAILEDLMDKRPLLLSSVLLRQNPNVVAEWIKRVEIYRDRNNLPMVVETYKQAVGTIEPLKVIGKLQDLWIQFARFFEEHDDGDLSLNVRELFEEALKVHFAHADDVASIWCEWIEMELKYENYAQALQLARSAITHPKDTSNAARMKSVRSKKLWYLVLDLEENFGTFDTTSATYERMIEMKIATPQTIINYAHYLEEYKYFEKAFKIYERGVTLFKQPHCNDLWLFYLSKFMRRYKSKKLERARDLFEEAIRACSNSEVMQMRLHVLYAKLEERYGLAKKALAIYQQGCEACKKDPDIQVKMWTLLVVRTGEIKGGDVARNVLKSAIDVLPEGKELIHFGLLFAELENSFGELTRARVIYEHVSQYCDPRKYPKFWEMYQQFEILHGNADSFKEMRRIQRSVEAAYAQVHFNAPDITTQLDDLKDKVSLNPMAEAEAAMKEDPEKEGGNSLANKAASRKRGGQMDVGDDKMDAKRRKLLEDLGVTQRERDAYFEPCDSYTGHKLGYVFKTGIKGLGYYEDVVMQSASAGNKAGVISRKAVSYNEQGAEDLDLADLDDEDDDEGRENNEKTKLGEDENDGQAGGSSSSTGKSKKNKKNVARVLGDEEIDLADLDDDDDEVVETNAMPDFLDGEAKARLARMKEEEKETARKLRAEQERETLLPKEDEAPAKKKKPKPVGGALAKFQKKNKQH
ncbi:unnamed protein product [Amoebophrya sp. A25]|nr:unnamed protein product [Amoebophrya sp. A25]|eukprot:GSA25T00018347001.1